RPARDPRRRRVGEGRARQGALTSSARSAPVRSRRLPQIGAGPWSCDTARPMAGKHLLTAGAEPLALANEDGPAKDPAPLPRRSPEMERFGGARADFVAGLGRRLAELGALAQALEGAPGSERKRDDLRRRIHALAAGARLLRFASLSR